MSTEDPFSKLLKVSTNLEPPLSSFMQGVYDKYTQGTGGEHIRQRILDERDQKSLTDFKNKYSGLSPNDLGDMQAKSIEEIIENDKKFVLKLRERPDQKYKTTRGEIFEGLMFGFGDDKRSPEYFGFFGGDNTLHKTTEYDDRVNHVDSVLEFREESDSFLAIDFTTSTDVGLEGKLAKIVDNLKKNELSNIKYFEGDYAEPGQLENVPMVVVAIDTDTLENLCVSFEEGKKEFAEHPFQIFMLRNIENQLQAQLEILEKQDEKNKQSQNFLTAREAVEKALNETRLIIENKKSSLPKDIWERAEKSVKDKEYFGKINKFKAA